MKVIFAKQFYADIVDIKNYISKDSEMNALNVVNKIWEAVERIENFPNSGIMLNDRISEETNCRYMIIYSYAIVYEVVNDEILMKAVIHLKIDFNKIKF